MKDNLKIFINLVMLNEQIKQVIDIRVEIMQNIYRNDFGLDMFYSGLVRGL